MTNDSQVLTGFYFSVNEQLTFTRSFTEDNEILLLQRAAEAKNTRVLRGLLEQKE